MMMPFTTLNRLVHFAGASMIEKKKGPGSLTAADYLARALGWLSLGLGLVELAAPRRFTLKLGLRGQEGLVRGFGLREICAGIITLAVDTQAGLLSRIVGDGLDLAVLQRARHPRNRRHRNANTAAMVVGAILLVDILAIAAAISADRRSGLPFTRAPASRDR